MYEKLVECARYENIHVYEIIIRVFTVLAGVLQSLTCKCVTFAFWCACFNTFDINKIHRRKLLSFVVHITRPLRRFRVPAFVLRNSHARSLGRFS